MIAAVVCVDENCGIGSKGNLLFHSKEDIKFFRELTTGGIIVVGRKTYDTFPNGPLPNRENIIITRKAKQAELEDNVVKLNLEAVKGWLTVNNNRNVYIVGGGQVYRELLPYCDKIYMTKVYHAYKNVDTYFPNVFNMSEWKLSSKSEIKEEDGIRYQFLVFNRIVYKF